MCYYFREKKNHEENNLYPVVAAANAGRNGRREEPVGTVWLLRILPARERKALCGDLLEFQCLDTQPSTGRKRTVSCYRRSLDHSEEGRHNSLREEIRPAQSLHQ